MNGTINTLQKTIANDEEAFKRQQSRIALCFKNEVNRFMRIKESTDLTVAELDTISINAAKNYLTLLKDGF